MNKGFQALPDYVQRKIDPEAAEKFMGGGSVMQRPLFRQMGGPAEADMAQMAAMGQQYLMPQAQQPMAPQQVDPQQAAMVQAQEQHNMEDGQKVGEMYASEMMNRLDAAEDPKSMIDAFRGNEKPLEARYTELAGFVGEADANKTPESVLAMVQPTIMMTEEGAVDSGIGELMQGLVQSVEMEDDSQMAQGVGELMAMGAGNTPPVNFNQGGAVRHFRPGGPVSNNTSTSIDFGTSLMPYYKEAQGIRRDILGSPDARAAQLDEQKKLTQAQMLFDIAQAGLQFAGSTDGRSVAERLANSLAESQLAPRIGERAAQFQQMKDVQKQQEQQMDLSALDSAERQLAGAQGRAFEMNKLAKENLNRINLTEIEIGARQEAAKTDSDLKKALQEKKLNLEDKLANLKITATAAENSKDRSAQVLAANQLAAAQKQLATLNASLKVGNDLKVLGAKNNFELAKIEDAQEFELGVIDKKTGIDRVSAQSDRNFQAAQNSLARISTRFENQKDRDFRSDEAVLRREFDEKIKNLDLAQDDKDRALRHADMMITKAFEEHRLLQGDEKLTLDKLKIYFDQDYKNADLALKTEINNLKSLEVKNNNDLLEYLVGSTEDGTKRIDAFLDGTLDNSELYEGRLLKYTDPGREWNDQTKQYASTPGLRLPTELTDKLKKSTFGRFQDLYENVTGKRLKEVVPYEVSEAEESILFKNVTDPSQAFGSPSFLKNIYNKGVEAITLGWAGSPATETKEAIVAVKNLNNKFMTFFTQAAEIRESVFQQQKLGELVPNPGEFWTGDDEASSYARALVSRIADAEQIIVDRLNNENIPLDSGEYSKLDKNLKELASLKSGYQILANISDGVKATESVDSPNSEAATFEDLMFKMQPESKSLPGG